VARPKKYTDVQLIDMLEKYTKKTDIPILSEFAHLNNINRSYLYSLDPLKDTIKKLIDKKEAQLERKALDKEINVTMAIFSLKQLGWKDMPEQKQQDDRKPIPYEIIEDNQNTK